ncbi:hypothetical protein F2Q70_00045391 [Brassica cretica]|uniref:Uncharacterized protein n=1 Tax=Brassica cretica TaxID=69181 RepID=A0A8S9KCW0_BRACR|nr:hypothetical protein F2Q70_00045391 [Brassica cretica]
MFNLSRVSSKLSDGDAALVVTGDTILVYWRSFSVLYRLSLCQCSFLVTSKFTLVPYSLCNDPVLDSRSRSHWESFAAAVIINPSPEVWLVSVEIRCCCCLTVDTPRTRDMEEKRAKTEPPSHHRRPPILTAINR